MNPLRMARRGCCGCLMFVILGLLALGCAFGLSLWNVAVASASGANVTRLSKAIAESDYRTTPAGVFYEHEVMVTFDGGEVWLAGTPDGTGEIVTDDRVKLVVSHADGSQATWEHDFQSADRTRIVSLPTPELSELFEVGQNQVKITLTDVRSFTYSSSAYYLVMTDDQESDLPRMTSASPISPTMSVQAPTALPSATRTATPTVREAPTMTRIATRPATTPKSGQSREVSPTVKATKGTSEAIGLTMTATKGASSTVALTPTTTATKGANPTVALTATTTASKAISPTMAPTTTASKAISPTIALSTTMVVTGATAITGMSAMTVTETTPITGTSAMADTRKKSRDAYVKVPSDANRWPTWLIWPSVLVVAIALLLRRRQQKKTLPQTRLMGWLEGMDWQTGDVLPLVNLSVYPKGAAIVANPLRLIGLDAQIEEIEEIEEQVIAELQPTPSGVPELVIGADKKGLMTEEVQIGSLLLEYRNPLAVRGIGDWGLGIGD